MTFFDPFETPENAIRRMYPQSAWAMNHPELGPLLRQAAAEKWDESRLLGALEATNWWKTTSATQREWTRAWNEDPKSAQDKFNAGLSAIDSMTSRLGIAPLQDWDRAVAATLFASEGWDQQRLASYLVSKNTAVTNTGEVKATADAVKQRAAQYLMPMTDEAAVRWARDIAQGNASLEGMEGYLRSEAKKRFLGDPTIGAALDQGATAKQIFEPMRQQTAQLLELSPETVDFMDPRWMSMIDSVQADGVRRPMTLSEAAQHVRSMDEFKTTQGANQQVAALGETILKTFGKVA